MQVHAEQFAVGMMCRVLSVSASGYYDWRNRDIPKWVQARAELDSLVEAEFKARKGRAGATRLSRHLQRGRRQVAQSLHRKGLRAKAARKFKATTNSNHGLPMAENLLQQNFTASRPDQVRVGDITYIGTDPGWLYLAVVMDVYSRRIVGWSMGERMSAALVCDALRMVLFNRKMPRGIITHPDRGSQYCSHDNRGLLAAHGLIAGMSAMGYCYDNAAMESWNHNLKVEAIHGERFATREQARAHVFEYIEILVFALGVGPLTQLFLRRLVVRL